MRKFRDNERLMGSFKDVFGRRIRKFHEISIELKFGNGKVRYLTGFLYESS